MPTKTKRHSGRPHKESTAPLLENAGEHCNVCLVPTTMRCTRCHRVYYCSEDHCKADIKRHSAECDRIQDSLYAFGKSLLQNKPASDSDAVYSDVWHPKHSVSAILLPADATEPREVKLRWEWIVDADAPGGGYQNIHVKPKWFEDDIAVRNMYIDSVPGDDGTLVLLPEDRRLALVYNAHFLQDSSPINKCVSKLLNAKGASNWRDNLLLLRSKGTPWKDHDYRDANLKEDLPVVLRFFKASVRDEDEGVSEGVALNDGADSANDDASSTSSLVDRLNA
ncbi:hypothetical protein BD626DRAFT_504324 [Schizophyllum amplum]|uniref:MYND-type domain-containing protein n=1 Tax=Schizophyllum amplum TaxID=97359 RepID=A0A550C6W4_9AGAR|nr:hypothetical protein BD626DRAFT_504324 [Auriculariopsis ampla]